MADESSGVPWGLLGLGGVASLCCVSLTAVSGAAVSGGAAAGALGGSIAEVLMTVLVVSLVGLGLRWRRR